ncbi:class I SAM-dependent rRNA methyltransferase [Geobacter sp. DSM 9736]|uniref:class I SAM-dependent rRNA methyltransferase n=1 Tax=Geobacter sp. DSM 9736 TaxID=1277350 RepID=UPI000B50ED09|nr:class I SAM-dependent rRNA methyltransferase [Geobacter sp. DSM 9736]SNB46313.1 SAM-dependent methyltransferase [Geobacter sp. DSM 9736]
MLRITLGRKEEKRLRGGHPWVFSNEIAEIAGDKVPGAAAEVYDAGGGYVGTGHYNPRSLIAVRLLTRERGEDVDSAVFYAERFRRAQAYRQLIYPDLTSCRLVHGEGDHLSGLVVDRYGEILSVQFLSAGMEARRELVVEALQEVFSPRGIIARNDVAVRALEGLDERVEILAGDVPETVVMDEHGLQLLVDLRGGQKTGHFLDQKENHLLLEGISRGGDVLDCFSYSGSWGIHAAAFGARSVTCVDISPRAVALAERNAAMNGLGGTVAVEALDAFDRLRSLKHEGRRFDVVVLDPPAFVKSKKALREAQKGYLTINRRAMELLRPGGYLITCSCSYHMEREMFRDLLTAAAQQAGREFRLIGIRGQAPDHPVLLAVPETDYLKCFMLQAV